MFDWVFVVLAGALIGWLASIIMKTNAEMGALANIVVGLFGAVIGRFISGMLFGVQAGTNFSIPGIVFGVVGACVLIAIVKALTGRRAV